MLNIINLVICNIIHMHTYENMFYVLNIIDLVILYTQINMKIGFL